MWVFSARPASSRLPVKKRKADREFLSTAPRATQLRRSAIKYWFEGISMLDGDSTTGIVLFAHGSSVQEANDGVRELARQVRDAGPYAFVREAFLESAQPDLGAALAEAAQSELKRVIIIPFFLTMGIHLRRDLPRLVEVHRERYPGLEVQVGSSLEGLPEMPSILLGRVREALGEIKAAR
jgi:sirohydrochlorin ferrochelatase